METQRQQSGQEYKMKPRPRYEDESYRGSGKLEGKKAIISSGDSGIGRAVAVAFAKEGADVTVVYLSEDKDAKETQEEVRRFGAECLLLSGDIGDADFCRSAVEASVKRFGAIDIIVNNAAEQHPKKALTEITPQQLERTFRTNIFGYFFLTQAALPYLKEGAAIVNCASVTAYRGSEELLDYSSTKGAIISFTRSLSKNLASQGIRVNAVAPGPVITPLIPSTFEGEKLEKFGESVPMGRPAQPSEIAPAFVFLASQDSSYMSGQVLHPNGGEVVGG